MTWTAAEKAFEYDDEAMRTAKLQLGSNAEIRSLLQRAQEIKTERHKHAQLVRSISTMPQIRSV